MSRLRKTTVIASFGYAQYALAFASAIVLVPLTLQSVGARAWGLWLASGEMLSYVAMVDLGTLGVLPWLVAEAEGSRDVARARRFLSQGLWLGLVAGVLFLAVAAALWWWLPSILSLSEAERALIGPPLALVVGLTAVRYPASAFRAALVGTQDVYFNGALAVVGAGLTVIITAAMLLTGFGLMALACASAVPPVVIAGASAFRLYSTRRDLAPRWEWPRRPDLGVLLTGGLGVWVGSLGWQLVSASNAIVLAYIGHPEWVVIYACTAKLGASFMQLAWILPDSAEVSLAQLHGEAPPVSRLREVVLIILRLHLLLAGGVAVGLLAFNRAFVASWVGPGMFGGATLTVLLAVGVVFQSLVHGVVTSAAVLGNRPRVGLAVLINGVVQLGLAVLLAQRLGLIGIAWAGLAAAAMTTLPAGLALLKPTTSISIRDVFDSVLNAWLARIAPLVAAAVVFGLEHERLGVWTSPATAILLAAGYVWVMRPLFDSLPFNPRLAHWLVRLRLLDDRRSPVEAL